MADFTVAICTRNRPDQVRATLAALAAQTDPRFPLLVVDQSDEVDPEVAAVLARAP
jgi:glycosyltransferase involved in cell wall biosynthesis